MRIFLDHNVPAPLRYWLRGHQVETAYERGWAEVSNGELLGLVESAAFDLMITTDQSIRYQQDLAGRKLALVAINTNDWTHLRNWKSAVLDGLVRAAPGSTCGNSDPAPVTPYD
jgi:hypothetical protein